LFDASNENNSHGEWMDVANKRCLLIPQLTEDVARKKAEYQKHLDYYKQLRMRFEEHYIKCEFPTASASN
jgi:hypothetical protein